MRRMIVVAVLLCLSSPVLAQPAAPAAASPEAQMAALVELYGADHQRVIVLTVRAVTAEQALAVAERRASDAEKRASAAEAKIKPAEQP